MFFFFSILFFVSVKERQCKFPLAHILRQPWQDEVITEWLTHHHGKDLSPPGKEIAKSQFTHIQLPVWAWSRSCESKKPHTNTLTPSNVRTHPHAPKQVQLSATTETGCLYLIFFLLPFCFACKQTHVRSVSPHASTWSSFPVKHTYLHLQSMGNDSITCRCVKGDRRRENPRIGWQTEGERERVVFNLYPSLNTNSLLEDGGFDLLTRTCSSHAETHVVNSEL